MTGESRFFPLEDIEAEDIEELKKQEKLKHLRQLILELAQEENKQERMFKVGYLIKTLEEELWKIKD